jgi:sugar lactone lactonase YvrE
MPVPVAHQTACAAISTATSGALPERCANVCFGGLKRNRLFMAASQSLYALYVNTQGVQGG